MNRSDKAMPPPGARLRLDRLHRQFGDAEAVRDVSLDLSAGSFTALVGPSGCGKSTLLSLIAGLLAPDRGSIHIDDDTMSSVPAERRPVGLVFQKPLLLPHLNVRDNVAFGLRMRHVARRAARADAQQMLERVQLGGAGDRRITELSGGQEQRAALARALVLAPRVLLLDEPFSQLDAPLRVQMRHLVRELADEAKVTTLFVTHDQGEAVEIADQVALMDRGILLRHGTPQSFFTDPPSLAAARFFGATNEIHGHVCDGVFRVSDQRTHVRSGLPNGPAVLVVRPESLHLTGSTSAPGVHTAGLVMSARFAGDHTRYTVDTGHRVELVVHAPLECEVTTGDTVEITAAAGACRVFPETP